MLKTQKCESFNTPPGRKALGPHRYRSGERASRPRRAQVAGPSRARRGRLAKGEGASGASESPTRGTTLAPACSVAAPGAESRFRESPPVWAESPVCKAQSPFGKGPSRPSRGPSRPSCVVPVAPFAVPVGPSRSQWERETSHSAKGDSDQASTRSSSSSSSSSEFRVQSLFEQNNSKPTKLSSSPDSSNSSSSSAHRWLALVALQAPKPSVSTRGGGGRAW